jgi:hypothetical protein
MYEQNQRNRDGERDLCRQILIVAIKDAISEDCGKFIADRHRNTATKWFSSNDDRLLFSFDKVVEYIFGDEIDADILREKILEIIERGTVSGIKNIEKIFGFSEGDI